MEDFKQKYPTMHRHLFTVTTFSKILAMILFIALPFLGFYLGMKYKEGITVKTDSINSTTSKPSSKVCTQEAKQCPDGSYVFRTGPNCEFSSCPSAITTPRESENKDWKTYNNNAFLFSFKYPQDFTIEDSLPKEDKNEPFLESSQSVNIINKPRNITISCHINPGGFGIGEGSKISIIYSAREVDNKLLLENRNYTNDLTKQDGNYSISFNTITHKNVRLICFSVDFPASNAEKADQIFKEILATLKFTN